MDGRITNISALLKELNLNLSRPECGVLATGSVAFAVDKVI